MPSFVVAGISDVTVSLDLNAQSTSVIGLIVVGMTTRPFRIILLDDDEVTVLRTIDVAQNIGDLTVALTPPQRKVFTIGSFTNTRGEPVQIMTRPFYHIEGL